MRHGSCRVVVSPLTFAGTGVVLAGVDARATPCTAAGSEVDDRADGWGLGIRGRKRGEGKGMGELGRALGRSHCGIAGPARAGEGKEDGKGLGYCGGPRGREERD